MSALFQSTAFQIFGAAMNCLIWLSVGWGVMKAWYGGQPTNGIVAAAAAMGCLALALQVLSNGLKLIR